MSLRKTNAVLLGGLLTLGIGRAAEGVPSLLGSAAALVQGTSPWPNHVALIGGGHDALLLRVHLIREARRSVAIQTFIWTNDECGRLLIYELVEAARRGVKVRIIADHFASDQDPEVVAFLATVHPNLELKHYRPAMSRIRPSLLQTLFAGMTSFRSFNQRMHNKVMLVDEAVLLTGGRNVENTYFDHSTSMNFRDRDILVAGPVVRDAVRSFEHFWSYRHSVASRDLVDVQAVIAAGTYRRYDARTDYDFGPHFGSLDAEIREAVNRFVARWKPVRHVTFIADEPGKAGGFFSKSAWIARELRVALEKAKTSVVIQSPYLVLSRPARRLFREIQDKNPQLRIRISSNSFAATDNLLAYSGNYRLRNVYVQDLNLHVYEFKPHPASLETLFPRHGQMAEIARQRAAKGGSVTAEPSRPPFLCLHAKSLVVDDSIAFIGSYNLDPRSEELNTEVGLLIEDESIARELRAEIERDMAPENSWVIARRRYPLRLEAVNGLVAGVLSLSPLDVWPIQNTTSFELRPGASAVPPDHPNFHEHYDDAGPFPGTEGPLSAKEILTRIYKAVGSPLTPIL